MPWRDLADWWLQEVTDPAYEEEVTPVLMEVLSVAPPGGIVADLGSGQGRLIPRVASALGASVVGVELSASLARLTSDAPVVVSRLPGIPFRAGSLDGAYAVLVLEHVEDHEEFFVETARVVRPGGFLAVVSNHPFWTAPGSTPILDTDGELLWRPGSYFDRGVSAEPAGAGQVVFHHRSMSDLLGSAADAGWSLAKMVEKPPRRDDDMPEVPRLVGWLWTRT